MLKSPNEHDDNSITVAINNINTLFISITSQHQKAKASYTEPLS